MTRAGPNQSEKKLDRFRHYFPLLIAGVLTIGILVVFWPGGPADEERPSRGGGDREGGISREAQPSSEKVLTGGSGDDDLQPDFDREVIPGDADVSSLTDTGSVSPDLDVAGAEPSWEFTTAELDAEQSELVTVSFGGESVCSAGEELIVEVAMDAPPLQAVVLGLVFDRSLLEPIPGSAEAVGSVFREGVEFFIHPEDGKAALFCATRPGKKNVLSADNAVVARFRMLAKAPGTAVMAVDTKGTKFMGGSGHMLDYDFFEQKIVVTD